jgi:hypothetical protein
VVEPIKLPSSRRMQRVLTALAADADSLPLNAAAVAALKRHAEAIKSSLRSAGKEIIEVGYHLIKAQEKAGHGNWLRWIGEEFAWAEQTARNYMNVYAMSQIHNGVGDLDLPLRSLYLLAAPSTPEPVRREVIDQAARGEPPPHARIKNMVEKAIPKKAKTNHKPAPEPSTQDELIGQIIDLFKRLDRHAQARCARMVQNISQGRA